MKPKLIIVVFVVIFGVHFNACYDDYVAAATAVVVTNAVVGLGLIG